MDRVFSLGMLEYRYFIIEHRDYCIDKLEIMERICMGDLDRKQFELL
jgi:hypothetical protein